MFLNLIVSPFKSKQNGELQLKKVMTFHEGILHFYFIFRYSIIIKILLVVILSASKQALGAVQQKMD